jgi:hypothetical protein
MGQNHPQKKLPKNTHDEEYPEGRKHSQDDLLLRKKRNDRDKGIQAKVEVHRDFQLKGKSGLDDEKEKEEKGKSLNRPSQVGNRFFHAAVTFFTRTFERLIWPKPKSKAFLTNWISSGLKGFPVLGCLKKAAA